MGGNYTFDHTFVSSIKIIFTVKNKLYRQSVCPNRQTNTDREIILGQPHLKVTISTEPVAQALGWISASVLDSLEASLPGG